MKPKTQSIAIPSGLQSQWHINDKRSLVRKLEDSAVIGQQVTLYPVEAQYLAELVWKDINGKVRP